MQGLACGRAAGSPRGPRDPPDADAGRGGHGAFTPDSRADRHGASPRRVPSLRAESESPVRILASSSRQQTDAQLARYQASKAMRARPCGHGIWGHGDPHGGTAGSPRAEPQASDMCMSVCARVYICVREVCAQSGRRGAQARSARLHRHAALEASMLATHPLHTRYASVTHPLRVHGSIRVAYAWMVTRARIRYTCTVKFRYTCMMTSVTRAW